MITTEIALDGKPITATSKTTAKPGARGAATIDRTVTEPATGTASGRGSAKKTRAKKVKSSNEHPRALAVAAESPTADESLPDGATASAAAADLRHVTWPDDAAAAVVRRASIVMFLAAEEQLLVGIGTAIAIGTLDGTEAVIATGIVTEETLIAIYLGPKGTMRIGLGAESAAVVENAEGNEAVRAIVRETARGTGSEVNDAQALAECVLPVDGPTYYSSPITQFYQLGVRWIMDSVDTTCMVDRTTTKLTPSIKRSVHILDDIRRQSSEKLLRRGRRDAVPHARFTCISYRQLRPEPASSNRTATPLHVPAPTATPNKKIGSHAVKLTYNHDRALRVPRERSRA